MLESNSFDWAMGEATAFGSLLLEGWEILHLIDAKFLLNLNCDMFTVPDLLSLV